MPTKRLSMRQLREILRLHLQSQLGVRKQARLLKAAKLKLHATAQGIDYSHPRGLKQSVMASLLQCHWVNKH